MSEAVLHSADTGAMPLDELDIDWQDLAPRLLLYAASRLNGMSWRTGSDTLPPECDEHALVLEAIRQSFPAGKPWGSNASSLFHQLTAQIDRSIVRLEHAQPSLLQLDLASVKHRLADLELDPNDLLNELAILNDMPAPIRAGRRSIPAKRFGGWWQGPVRRLLPGAGKKLQAASGTAVRSSVAKLGSLWSRLGDSRWYGKSRHALKRRLPRLIACIPFDISRLRNNRPLLGGIVLALTVALLLPFLLPTDEPQSAAPAQSEATLLPTTLESTTETGADSTSLRIVNDKIQRGDTLSSVLARNAIDAVVAERIAAAMAPVKYIDPTRLQLGQDIELQLIGERARILQTLTLPGKEYDVVLTRTADGEYRPEIKNRLIDQREIQVAGQIESSFFRSARAQGVPPGSLLRLLSFLETRIDFTRDVQAGDRFEISYEVFLDKNERPVKNGEIVSAVLYLSKKNARYSLVRDGDSYRMEQQALSVDAGNNP